jgi:thioredoxin 1
MIELFGFEEYESFIGQSARVNSPLCVLKFGAEWCGPCKAVREEYYSLETSKPYKYTVIFGDVDIDEADDLMDMIHDLEVKTLPSFIIFKNAKEIDRVKGANITLLKQKLDSYLLSETGVESRNPAYKNINN